MSNELTHLALIAARGQINRRHFLGRAAALGIAAPLASQMLASTARAQTPRRGGHLIEGLQGGATTDSLDPASYASTVPYTFGECKGEPLIETFGGKAVPVLAETWEATPDARRWTFKIRKGVTFHDRREMTVVDVVQTLRRHSNEETKSGALGILKTIGQNFRADGDSLVVELEDGNADLPFLLSDYHLVIQPNGGFDDPEVAQASSWNHSLISVPGGSRSRSAASYAGKF